MEFDFNMPKIMAKGIPLNMTVAHLASFLYEFAVVIENSKPDIWHHIREF